MDEATGEGSQAIEREGTQEQRSPEEIQRDIEATRAELGGTVEQLAGKADVKGQAKEHISSITEKAQDKKDEFVSKAKDSTPDGASAGVQQVKAKAESNPLPFAVGGALLAGFVLGRLSSR